MFRGTYIAGTGMLLQRRLMENITHNITNVDTTGYKKDQLVSRSFEDVLIQRHRDYSDDPNILGVTRWANRNYPVGPLNFGTRVDQIFTDFDQGIMEETGRTTDVALTGEGFFVVSTEAGDRYTRSGAFYLTPNGYLVDSEGNYVQGTEGPVYVGGEEFQIRTGGEVVVNDEQVNQLRIVNFEDPGVLRKQGDSLYYIQGGAQPQEGLPENSTVRQYFLEGSNVEIAREMVDMITVYRTYESNQKMLTMMDEIAGKAVNEIGRLR